MKTHKRKASRKTSKLYRFLRRCHQNLLTALFMGPLFNPAALAADPSLAAGIPPQPVVAAVTDNSMPMPPEMVPNESPAATVIQPSEKIYYKDLDVSEENWKINYGGKSIQIDTISFMERGKTKADILIIYPRGGKPFEISLPAMISGSINGDSFASIGIGWNNGKAVITFYEDKAQKKPLKTITLEKLKP